ncbi:MAG: redox-sensing transcriptional repressor Rex, partial [Phycisphaerales bacterium]
MPERNRISKPAARRLSQYLRTLQARLDGDASTTRVSSRELGEQAGVADAQVRKDLASFGAGGQPGVGYQVRALHDGLRRALGLDKPWRAVLVGAGNIGRALLAYPRFGEEGFDLVAVFDRASAVVGRRVAGHAVQPMSNLQEAVRRSGAQLGIVAVPPDEAQDVADALVRAGIQGVLNFAPRALRLPAHVAVVAVDFTEALERLAFEASLKPA